jgi:hypothetical protein
MKKTKQDKVLSHLKRYKSINTWTAIQRYNATRLSGIIHVLRSKGYSIASLDRKATDGGRFVQYKLMD